MGLRAVGIDPIGVVQNILGNEEDKERRRQARRRLMLYRDCSGKVLSDELHSIVKNKARRERIEAFAWLANALSAFKRITNDRAAPVYATPPVRKVGDDERDQLAYKALVEESSLNARMDLALRFVHAMNAAALFVRYVPRLGLVTQVISPEAFSVIPDPDDPVRELAVIYDRKVVMSDGSTRLHRVLWDDEVAIQIDENGHLYPGLTDATGQPAFELNEGNGHPGVLPFVVMHLTERAGSYWDSTTGDDLAAGQTGIGFVGAATLRLVNTQGHTQLALNTAPGGDPGTMPKGQPMDQESPLIAGEGNSLSVLHNPTDPSSHLKVAEHIITALERNYGLGVDNFHSLLEHREQAIKIAADGERRMFALYKIISRAHKDPARRLSVAAELRALDFAEISHRVERQKLLDIWEREMQLGVRNYLDNVMQDNPELAGDEEKAEAELERNLEINTKWKARFRALDMPANGNIMQPGLPPPVNGALGPAVRDGLISRDVPADLAKNGPVAPPRQPPQ